MWIYDDKLQSDDPYTDLYGSIHSSMYKNLTCNLPKQLMQFKDYPHKEETPILMSQEQFLEYT